MWRNACLVHVNGGSVSDLKNPLPAHIGQYNLAT